MKFLMIYPNSTGNTKVPLGILYILTLLKNQGHEVALFDMTTYGVDVNKHDIHIRGENLNFRPVELEPYGVVYKQATMKVVENDLVTKIQKFSPDVIGISITEDTSTVGLRLAEVCKQHDAKIPIVFGGVYCMTMPDFVISQPQIDVVCVGEGEQAMLQLMKNMSEGQDIVGIQGLWVKTSDGVIHKTEVAPPTDLDSLPYMDLSLIDDIHFYAPMAGHVYKMVFVEGQRGCPRRCSYCCNQLFLNAYKKHIKGYLRKKSIPRLIDELVYLKENYGFNFFQFTDDDFMLRTVEELRQFSEMYKQKINLPFWIQAEANNITDEKVKLISDAGCISISIGIETGSDYVREQVYKRKTSKEVTLKAFEIMHRHGIRTSGNIIIGVPFEGRKEIFETIELARKCEARSLNVNIFAPYLGTELRDEAVRLGYLNANFIRKGSESWKAVLDMPQITKQEVEGLARAFVLYATLPETYYNEIMKWEQGAPESDEIFKKLEKIFWQIAEKRGIDYHVHGIDYEGFLVARKAELLLKN